MSRHTQRTLGLLGAGLLLLVFGGWALSRSLPPKQSPTRPLRTAQAAMHSPGKVWAK